jgi:hypothetical protein
MNTHTIIQAMLEAWEDQHGPGACDCRPEPENQGHVCCWCQARAIIAAQPEPAIEGRVFEIGDCRLEDRVLPGVVVNVLRDDLKNYPTNLFGQRVRITKIEP